MTTTPTTTTLPPPPTTTTRTDNMIPMCLPCYAGDTKSKTWSSIQHSKFSLLLVYCLSFWIIALWLCNLLLCSGDIHPNPGPLPITPSSNLSSSSSDMSNTAFGSLSLVHNLSIVHYNVQSIFSKLEILHAKLFESDILALTETWLGPTIDTDDFYNHTTDLSGNIETHTLMVMSYYITL